MRSLAFLAPCVVLLACGPSQKEIRDSKSAVYETEYAVVWNHVVRSVRSEYPNVKIEDAVNGRLETHWHRIQYTSSDDDVDDNTEAVGGGNRPGAQVGDFRGKMLFRLFVKVMPDPKTGGAPWTVEVDGEAAEYRPGLAMLVPFRHGQPDEPHWVPTRIDKMYVKIYEGLKKHARIREPSVKSVAASDTSRWEGLPSDAVAVIAGVHDAAARKKADPIRRHMGETFSSSVAGEVPADQAVVLWKADPTQLVALARTLEMGCASENAGARIVCPPTSGAAGHASHQVVFEKRDGGWKLVAVDQP